MLGALKTSPSNRLHCPRVSFHCLTKEGATLQKERKTEDILEGSAPSCGGAVKQSVLKRGKGGKESSTRHTPRWIFMGKELRDSRLRPRLAPRVGRVIHATPCTQIYTSCQKCKTNPSSENYINSPKTFSIIWRNLQTNLAIYSISPEKNLRRKHANPLAESIIKT